MTRCGATEVFWYEKTADDEGWLCLAHINKRSLNGYVLDAWPKESLGREKKPDKVPDRALNPTSFGKAYASMVKAWSDSLIYGQAAQPVSWLQPPGTTVISPSIAQTIKVPAIAMPYPDADLAGRTIDTPYNPYGSVVPERFPSKKSVL